MSRAQVTRNNVLNKKMRNSKIFKGVVAIMSTVLVWPITFGATWAVGQVFDFTAPFWVSFLMASPMGIAYLVIGSED